MASPPYTPPHDLGADDSDQPGPRLPDPGPTARIDRHAVRRPASGTTAAASAPPPPVSEPRWQSFGTYVLLAVMTLADAFGFWITLTRIIRQDTLLVLVFVVALALGSLLAAHQAGRLARSRREGYDGSWLWITLLVVLWLALGGTVAYLRADQQGLPSAQVSGPLAPAASASTDGNAVQLAWLLLVLYLLTGALAITHGYRRGDPRSAATRQAYARREEVAMALADRRYEAELARGLLTLRRTDLQREEVDKNHEHEVEHGHAMHLKTSARRFTARHVGDPAGTDELYSGGSSVPPPIPPDWSSEPPEI